MGLFFNYNFDIRLLEKRGTDELFSTEGREILHIGSDLGLFKRNPLCICADPFLFVRGDELFLFFESQRRHRGKGELHMTKTSDLEHWSEEVCILREPFHLSFPNVFEHGGQVYMIPESGADGSVRLYRAADDSLTRWELQRKILDTGVPWVDSSLLNHDGVWYLFTGTYSRKSCCARLFFSDSLDGVFKEHPCSPICSDSSYARNAGSIIKYEGGLYRPVQDCSVGYGKQVSIMRIDALSTTEYGESLFKKHILDKSEPFYKWGGHQFNIIRYKGRTITATDAKKRNYNILDYLKSL